jgi:DNA-binding HxlR family transcriptional regulator
MPAKPYGMICPITHAAEVLEPRWTLPILTELWAGSTRFNDIRRGIGNISPALLSKRLKELEAMGLVERIEDRAAGTVDYLRTRRAIDLEPALTALSEWAQCSIQARHALRDSDVSTLMWKMRTHIITEELPNRQVVIQFRFTDPGLAYDTYWALCRPGAPVEICSAIPDFDIDVYVETEKILGTSDQRLRLRRDGLLIFSNTMVRASGGCFRAFRAVRAGLSLVSGRLVLMPSASVAPGTGCRGRTV